MTEPTPWELVLQHFKFPDKIGDNDFIPRPKQIESINELAVLPNSGHWLDMATGKTFVATACALYQKIVSGSDCAVIMPPLLVLQWGRWLRLIRWADGRPLRITEYLGDPKQREKLSFDADFVLTGIQLFKKDLARFKTHFYGRQYCGIVDEATFVSNIGTGNYETLHEFLLGHVRMMLSGTPANSPGDVYGLTTFTAPGTYRNLKNFRNIHAVSQDSLGHVTEWKELDLMRENLMKNSKRVLYEDMYDDIEKPLWDFLPYELNADHGKLYRKLANERMIELENGGKIDATSSHQLRHALGQIIVNYGHFAGSPGKHGTAVEMIEERLHALGDGKLLVAAHYRMSVRALKEKLGKYGVVTINSEVSNAQKDRNVQAFINDPRVRVIVIQYVSGGKGLDGLQLACHTVMCIEPCQQPRDFHQLIRRLLRPGQKRRVHVILPVAQRTLQVRAFKTLIANDTLINKVVPNAHDLRREIFGDETSDTP